MRDHREPLGVEGEEPGAPEASAEPARVRRLTRLIRPGSARRPALARMTLAAIASVIVLALVCLGGSRAFDRVRSWLHAQGAYQVRFDAIELDRPPPAWIKLGRAGLLEQVRRRSGLPEVLPALDLDLKTLERAFALQSPWVKRVDRVERVRNAAGALTYRVRLRYREPVALVIWPDGHRTPVALDDEGIVLPHDQIKMTAAEPMLWLIGLHPQDLFGTPEASHDLTAPAPKVVEAARLAAFLKRHQVRSSPSAPVGWSIVGLNLSWQGGLVLQTDSQVVILWGEPIGAEPPDRPSAEEKWTLLRDWFQRPDVPQVKYPQYLKFDGKEVEIVPAPAGGGS